MFMAGSQQFLSKPQVWVKTIFLSAALTSTVLITGCASKPQINNPVRYANAPEYYTVRSGDTLSAIAARYGLDYLSVANMNDIAEPYRIYVNQSLRLKKSGSYRDNRSTTQALSTNEPQIQRQTINIPVPNKMPVQNTTPVQVQQQAASTQNTIKNNPAIQPAPIVSATNLRWIKPSTGRVIENFNLTKNVKGIRFGGNVGDPIVAAANGQVVYAADGLKEYGNLVLIKHIDGYITAYAHNSKMLVKSGDNVVAGQKIAEMGSSGTTQTMLEFQVRLDGKPINPANILPIN